MEKPLVAVALSFIAGIVLGEGFLFFPWTIAACLLASAAAAVRFLPRNRSFVGACLLVSLCGSAITVFSVIHLPRDHYTQRTPLDGAAHAVSGRIASPLEREPGRTAFLLALDRIEDQPASGKIRVVLKEERPLLGYGDRITLYGKLYPVRGYRNPGGFDYPAYLEQQSVFAILSVRKGASVRVDTQGSGIFRNIQDWRERIRQALLRSMSGDGSAVLQAIILGEEGALTDELRDIFLAAGATHILSISGSHLGFVAIICFWLARNLLFAIPERSYHRLTIKADPRKIAALFAILPVTFYALLAGGQQATIRSLIMLLAGIAALLLDRDHDLPQALALAGLITLVPDPRTVFDVSFQLSYLSVAAILFVIHIATIAAPPAKTLRKRLFRDGALMLAVSLAATAATAPLVVYYFNRFSAWGIVSNMVIVPFAGFVVVPLGLFSGILSLATGSLPFAALNQLIGDAFVNLAAFFAALPGAMSAFPSPGPVRALSSVCLTASLGLLIRSRLLSRSRPLEYPNRLPRKALVVAVLSGLLLIPALFSLPGTRNDQITFLDVGQGDSALVETADGKTILIDGGGTMDKRFDVGKKVVAPFLWNRNIGTIDLLVLSHPHPDHMNGLTSILRTFRVREIWSSGRDQHLDGYDEFRNAVVRQGTVHRFVRAGDRMMLGNAKIEVLHPDPDSGSSGKKAYEAENNRSLVLRLMISGKRFLFPGDIHQEAENNLAEMSPALQSDILKIPHHGSKTSSSIRFLAAIHPAAAVISVGAGNPYRQPSEEVIARLNSAGITLYRTDRDGAITVLPRGEHTKVIPWASLALTRIHGTDPMAWWQDESKNWGKIWIRRAVT